LGRSRFVASLIVVAGIFLSFFGSFVTTDPPVAGMTHWSPFKIVLQMYYGELPSPDCERCNEPVVRSFLALPLEVMAEYPLMIFALVALYCHRRPDLIVWIAFVGIGLGLGGMWSVGTRLSFQSTFYGPIGSSGHVYYRELLIVYIVVMLALLLISLELNSGEFHDN
jgi:phosphatidylglycerophosphate synthase